MSAKRELTDAEKLLLLDVIEQMIAAGEMETFLAPDGTRMYRRIEKPDPEDET